MSANTTTPEQTASDLLAAADEAYKPCACRFVTVDGKRAACQRVTKRTFAPGHDAQLKSRLIKALVTGAQVGHVDTLAKDAPVTNTSAAEEAGKHNFGYQVSAGYARAQRLASEKAERKAARDLQREANRATRDAAKADAAAKREAAKAERDAAKAQAEQAKLVTAKVGRWEVTGTVAKDGSLTYTNKKGEEKTAPQGKWAAV